MSVPVAADVAALQPVFEWLRARRPCILFCMTDEADRNNRTITGCSRSLQRALLGGLCHGAKNTDACALSVERVVHAVRIPLSAHHTIALCNVILEGNQPIRRLEYNGLVKNCSHPARRLRLQFDFNTINNGVFSFSCPDQKISIQFDHWEVYDLSSPLVLPPSANRFDHTGARGWIELGPEVSTAPAMDVWPWITGFHLLTAVPKHDVPDPPTPVARFVRHRLYDGHLLRLMVQFVNAPSPYHAARPPRHAWVTDLPQMTIGLRNPWVCTGCRQSYW